MDERNVSRRSFLKGIGNTLLVSAVVGMTGCGKKSQPKTKTKEELLAGDWYSFFTKPALSIYDDGTYTMYGDYGTGHWAIVNEDQLKLTDFYGETHIMRLVDVDESELTLGSTEADIADGADPDARLVMYHTYEEAEQNQSEN